MILKLGQPAASYERGLRLARAVCRLEPDNGNFLNTLAIAEYRAGLVPEALANLKRSNALNQVEMPDDLASWPWPTSAWARPQRLERDSTGCAT